MDNIFNSSSIQRDNDVSNFKYEDSWQAKAVYFMERYVLLIMSIIAWINNSLVIAVLQTKTYRGTSTGFLLTALACADIGYMSTEATRNWIKGLTSYDIVSLSPMSCKLHSLMTMMLWGVSAWSIVLTTVERVVCVLKPLRVREMFSLRKTVTAWVIITAILFGFNLYFMWTKEIKSGTCSQSSFANLNEAKCWEILIITNLMVTYGVPFGIILLCNVIIVVSIARRAAWCRNSASTGGKVSSTTAMLTVNSVAFVILTSPQSIFLFLAENISFELDLNSYFTTRLFFVFCNLYSCLNIVLYCVFGSKFRRVLVELLLCKRSSCRCTRNVPPVMDPPEINPPEIIPPEIDHSEMNQLEINPPAINPPEMDPPEMDPPEMDPPEMDPSRNGPVQKWTRPEMDPSRNGPVQNIRNEPDQTNPCNLSWITRTREERANVNQMIGDQSRQTEHTSAQC